MSRENPYKSVGKATVVGKAFHNTQIALREEQIKMAWQTAEQKSVEIEELEEKIKQLEEQLGATKERLLVADDKINAMSTVNKRERAIVDALIGYKED